MTETPEARLKRMAMRSWRRGTKEMDLILGPWSDRNLAGLNEAGLQTYDRILEENDQDLMSWILGQSVPPPSIAAMLEEISAWARNRLSSAV